VDATRWQRARDVFQAALSRGPESRPAFVAEACGPDMELRREVEWRLRFGEALPLCEQAAQARGDAASGEELLWVRLTLGDALRRNGEPAAAVEGYRAVLTTAEALVPKDRSLRKFLAMAYDRIGQTLDQQHPGAEEALAARRQFVAVAGQIAGENPSVPRFRRNLGVGYENLAAALAERGLQQEGLEAVAKAQALYEALAREDAGNVQASVDLASACNVRARLLGSTGRGGEALATYGSPRTPSPAWVSCT
jgi:tetratricopeptide (TPR) repeat protein